MNYEERYKQAIETAKKELHCCGSLDCDAARQIFRLFPELKESEDEKIRKEIIQSIKDNMCVIHKDKCIAWLEKQEERKTPQWMIDFLDSYQRKIGCSLDYDEARDVYGRILCIKEWLEKQGEQNPSWSAEDEANMDAVWKACGQVYGVKYQSILGDWLKSLKPQKHWKPSEEQMSMLLAILNDSNNITAESVHIALKSLYQDLLKL